MSFALDEIHLILLRCVIKRKVIGLIYANITFLVVIVVAQIDLHKVDSLRDLRLIKTSLAVFEILLFAGNFLNGFYPGSGVWTLSSLFRVPIGLALFSCVYEG